MIITVKQGDTVFSISRSTGVPASKIVADNAVENDTLVVGQSLIIDIPDEAITVTQDTTANEISSEYGVEVKNLFRNNYILGGDENIKSGTFVVLSYKNEPVQQKIIGGYAYDFISPQRLLSVINYLTYIMPFTYGFTAEGTLVEPYDGFILESAKESGVKALMHVSTLTDEGNFDSNLPSLIFADSSAQQALIDNILQVVESKGYFGVDIDFEFLPMSEKENYVNFTRLLAQRLHEAGKILVIAVPPKVSDGQGGLLVEGIDYEKLGKNADYLLIMAYEYGYKYGPPLAIAPVNQVTMVLDYAISRVENEKILLGLSNYGYDWTLPYVRGESDAPSISTVEAIELAKKYGAEILFDEQAKAPHFFYTDEDEREHEVWFEDARSFEAKMNLIKDYNLAGGFIWDLMRENPQGYVTINNLVKIL